MEQYKDFAFVYDELMNEVDYNGWVKYIEDIIKNENAQVQNILELACGTGNLTIPLTQKNYEIYRMRCLVWLGKKQKKKVLN